MRNLEHSAVPEGASTIPFLKLQGISKMFGSFAALKEIDLSINSGEFICFLGPSGCGKSTLLRIIAGLEAQSAGRIMEGGRDISKTSPAERRFGILFQSYALFPNLTVYENVVYGLNRRVSSKAELAKRAAELLELVDMTGADKKFPAQLSGGQQQRVALARAIAPNPRLLLLDEPLSALDAKVRVHLRRQIRDLQRRLAVTTVMVTHDQEEALTMADRVVVMNQGTVEQVGTPTEIYHAPKTPFVANFVGKMNFIPAQLEGNKLRLGSTILELSRPAGCPDGAVQACIRPEHIGRTTSGGLAATVSHMEFLGTCWRVSLALPSLGVPELVADFAGGEGAMPPCQIGARVSVTIPPERIIVFPAGSRAAGNPSSGV